MSIQPKSGPTIRRCCAASRCRCGEGEGMATGPLRKAAPRPRLRDHHPVYAVKLADRVWNEPRFRKAIPDHQLGRPFVDVGMTGLEPDLRFDKHKAGIQANRFVCEYGLCLLPALYEGLSNTCPQVRAMATSVACDGQVSDNPKHDLPIASGSFGAFRTGLTGQPHIGG